MRRERGGAAARSERTVGWRPPRPGAKLWSLAFGATFLVATAAPAASLDCCGCLADINKDGTVAGDDLGLLLGAWQTPGLAENDFCEDVNGDGRVDGADLGLLLAAWQSCEPSILPRCQRPGICSFAEHDCCTTGYPGCTDHACCETVCAIDAYCCDVFWDLACIHVAIEACGACVNPACGRTAQHDCATTGAPGCSDESCCGFVCVFDDFCCSGAWDLVCVKEAELLCLDGKEFSCTGTDEGEPCGESTNHGCDVTFDGSNCCYYSGGLGCDDASCTEAVCAVDPFCCDEAWDEICMADAWSLCPVLCAPSVPHFGTISCGETICGTVWSKGEEDDTDWYIFENATGAPQEIVLVVNGTLPIWFGKRNNPACGSVLYPNAASSFGPAALMICADVGQTWIYLKPNAFGRFPCENDNRYSLSVICTGTSCDANGHPDCPNPAHDCFTAGEAGCSDEDCCNTVCGVDISCCSFIWDGMCVGEASALCGP